MLGIIMTKICSNCNIEKLVNNFPYVNKRQCRACINARNRAKYAENIEESRKTVRERKHKYKDIINANRRQKRKENPEYYQKQEKDWYERNPDKLAAKRAYNREWSKNNREYQNLKEAKRRAKIKENTIGEVPIDIKFILLEEQDYLCPICDDIINEENINRHVHLDHIIPISKDGPHCVENLQSTHDSCNLSKGDKIGYKII